MQQPEGGVTDPPKYIYSWSESQAEWIEACLSVCWSVSMSVHLSIYITKQILATIL